MAERSGSPVVSEDIALAPAVAAASVRRRPWWIGPVIAAAIFAVLGVLGFTLALGSVTTLIVVLLYVTIAAINALLLMLWGTYRKRVTRSAPQSRAPMDDVSQAERFALSGAQLEDIRLSRLLVIHHAEDGEISRWESADTSAIRLSA